MEAIFGERLFHAERRRGCRRYHASSYDRWMMLEGSVIHDSHGKDICCKNATVARNVYDALRLTFSDAWGGA